VQWQPFRLPDDGLHTDAIGLQEMAAAERLAAHARSDCRRTIHRWNPLACCNTACYTSILDSNLTRAGETGVNSVYSQSLEVAMPDPIHWTDGHSDSEDIGKRTPLLFRA
jgi:hypothetical protein